MSAPTDFPEDEDCNNVTPENKIQAFYDSEQNATITWFWDAGFTVTLGDYMNGYGEIRMFDTFEEVADYLYARR